MVNPHCSSFTDWLVWSCYKNLLNVVCLLLHCLGAMRVKKQVWNNLKQPNNLASFMGLDGQLRCFSPQSCAIFLWKPRVLLAEVKPLVVQFGKQRQATYYRTYYNGSRLVPTLKKEGKVYLCPISIPMLMYVWEDSCPCKQQARLCLMWWLLWNHAILQHLLPVVQNQRIGGIGTTGEESEHNCLKKFWLWTMERHIK